MVNSINLLLVKVRKWCVAQLGPIYRLDILYLLLFKINCPLPQSCCMQNYLEPSRKCKIAQYSHFKGDVQGFTLKTAVYFSSTALF